VSGRDRWWYFEQAPKRPPPEHGIRVGNIGSTWWGKRWIAALEGLSFGYSDRLARGKTYARAGRVHDLVAKRGEVTARVTGSRPTPYKVRIRLVTLGDAAWKEAIGAMASRAQFAAELLGGSMPHEIESSFREAGTRLFPVNATDLLTECNCPDVANPCKHVAAVHYVLGEALDRDPFLLFELRGRTKEQVLDALRVARAGHAGQTSSGVRRGARVSELGVDVPSVDLGGIDASAYDVPRNALPALHLAFKENVAPGALLRQLGAPPGWSNATSLEELLGPVVRAAADRARRIAMAEVEGSDVLEDIASQTVANLKDARSSRRG
jgi:uncharacterized Zn finger protein